MKKEITSRIFMITLICAVTSLAFAQELGPTTTSRENQYSPLGMNLFRLSYWDSNWFFVDLFKTAGVANDRGDLWYTQTPDEWDTEEQQELDLDEHGWVKSLPDQGASERYRSVAAYMRNASGFPAGNYTVLYDGEGTIEYPRDGEVVESQTGRDVVRLGESSTESGFLLRITMTNPDNYIRNIRVIMPGGICNNDPFVYAEDPSRCQGQFTPFVENYEEQILHPKFLQDIRHLKVLRFMGTFMTAHDPTGNWEERTQFPDAHWAHGKNGAPLELAIIMANAVNADAWLTMPYSADDPYVREAAKLTKQMLGKNQKIYLEYSNEVWNWAWPYNIGGSWIEEQGKNEWPKSSGSEYEKRLSWYGKRSGEMCDIWKDVWGAEKDRVKCVLAGQSSYDYVSEQMLSCPIHVENGGTRCADTMDYFAIAPYFGFLGNAEYAQRARSWVQDKDGGVNKFFEDLGANPLEGTFHDMEVNKKLADKYGLPLIAYEGGQAFMWEDPESVQHEPRLKDLFDRANGDPRIKKLYLDYMNGWKERGGEIFLHCCTLVEDSFQFDTLSYKDYQLQPRAEAPKFDAIMTFIEKNRCWWKGCQ